MENISPVISHNSEQAPTPMPDENRLLETPAAAITETYISNTTNSKYPSISMSVANLTCDICNTKFTLHYNLLRHQREKHGNTSKECTHCKRKFNRFQDLQRHQNSGACHRQNFLKNRSTECSECHRKLSSFLALQRHQKSKVCYRQNLLKNRSTECPECHRKLSSFQALQRHQRSRVCSRRKQKNIESVSPTTEVTPDPAPVLSKRVEAALEQSQSAFGGIMRDTFIPNSEGYLDLKEFLQSLSDDFHYIISMELKKFAIKLNVRLVCIYAKNVGDMLEQEEKSFKTQNNTILESKDIQTVYNSFIENLLIESSEFEQKESGWSLIEIRGLEVRTNKFSAFR